MRASYPRAIAWLAFNDDCAWLEDDELSLSVAAHLVADLFEKRSSTVAADLRKFRAREGLA